MVKKTKKKEVGKKKGKEKTDKEKKLELKNLKKRQEKQIRVFIVVMISLLIFIFIIYAFIQATLKFSYTGLEFEKVRQGDLILYRTSVFPIFLREDPRVLRDIPIEGKIILQKNIGIGGEKDVLEECEDSTLAATTLSIFYGRSGLQTFSASTNKAEAEEFDVTYVECNLNNDYSVILLKKGEENKISKKASCYILEAKDCEVMNIAERFIVASYAHSRGIEV